MCPGRVRALWYPDPTREFCQPYDKPWLAAFYARRLALNQSSVYLYSCQNRGFWAHDALDTMHSASNSNEPSNRNKASSSACTASSFLIGKSMCNSTGSMSRSTLKRKAPHLHRKLQQFTPNTLIFSTLLQHLNNRNRITHS